MLTLLGIPTLRQFTVYLQTTSPLPPPKKYIKSYFYVLKGLHLHSFSELNDEDKTVLFIFFLIWSLFMVLPYRCLLQFSDTGNLPVPSCKKLWLYRPTVLVHWLGLYPTNYLHLSACVYYKVVIEVTLPFIVVIPLATGTNLIFEVAHLYQDTCGFFGSIVCMRNEVKIEIPPPQIFVLKHTTENKYCG